MIGLAYKVQQIIAVRQNPRVPLIRTNQTLGPALQFYEGLFLWGNAMWGWSSTQQNLMQPEYF